jgi:DNA-binding protein YbaB
MTPSSTDHHREPLVRVRGRVTINTKDEGEVTENEFEWTSDTPIQENLMKAAEELLGDAAARVSVTMDMSSKSYGNGASAMVTVSLSCNQDDETIGEAFEVARTVLEDFVPAAYEDACDYYEKNRRKLSEAK